MDILLALIVVAVIGAIVAGRRSARDDGTNRAPPRSSTSPNVDFDGDVDHDPAITAHFDRNEQIEGAKRAGDVDLALALAETDIDQLESFLIAMNRDRQQTAVSNGEPDPGWQTFHLPAVDAIRQLAVARRDRNLIGHAHATLTRLGGMDSHTSELAQALDDVGACETLLAHLAGHPGARQAGLAKTLGHDGHRLRSIIHWLERDRQLARHRDGKTYRLYLPDQAPAAPPPPPADVLPSRPPVRFAAVDVETATGDRGSICAIAVTWVDRGQLAGTRHILVRPPENRYDPGNIAIHGIRPEHTAGAPTFDAVWDWLAPYLDGYPLVAHYAPFDRSAIVAALQAAGRTPPQLDMACTVRAARKVWPQLSDHKLPTVSAHVGHPVTRHHDAAADAEAAARIAISICDTAQIADIREL